MRDGLTRPQLQLLSASGADPAQPFRRLAESIPQLVWTARSDGRLDYANRRWSDYTGIDTEEIQGWSWKHTVHPDDLRSALDRWTTAVDHPAPYENEYRLRRHDGQYRWFLVRAEPIFDQEGRPVCWFGTCTDIDDGKRQQELTEERCSRIVAAAHDGVYEIELDGTTRFVNPRMAEMLGYSVDEMLGHSVFDFLFESDHAAARTELDRRSRRDNRTFDWRWRRRDGSELWTLASCSALTDSGGEVVGAVGLFTDLTERRKSEQRLQASEERFRTSVENLLDCFGIFTAVRDDHGRIVDFRIDYINQAGCTNNRLSFDAQVGRGLLEILPAHRDNGLFDEYCGVVETGRSVSKEMLFYEDTVAGERLRRWFDIRASKLRDGFVAAWRDVTQRKAAETVDESEAGFHRVLMEMAIPAILHAEDGEVLMVNKSWTRLTGYRHEDIPTLGDWTQRAYGERRAIVQQYIDDLFEANRRQDNGEWIVRTASGDQRTWHFFTAPVGRDRDGRRLVLSTAIDVTERKQSEMTLRESEERYRTLFNSIDEGFCVQEIIFDEHGRSVDYRFLEINPAFERHTGLVDAVGKTARQLVPDLEPSWAERYGHIAKTGERASFVEYSEAMGRWFEVDAFRIGEPRQHRVALLFNDITERKLAEAALHESEERFRTLADNIAQFAWMKDPHGHTYWYNKRWYDYTGTTLEDVEGWGWKKLHHPDHLDRVVASLQHSLRTGEVWEETFPLRGKDGRYRWFLTRGMPIRDPDGKIVRWFGTNTDITEQRNIEEQLQRTANELVQANRRKDEFLANISHEIRSPMTAILGYLDLLDLAGEDDRRHVETIRRNSEFLLALINDILDLSKVEAGQFEADMVRFRPDSLVHEVVELMEVRARDKGIDLTAKIATSLPEVVVSDALRVRQILVNLVGNAIKFTQQGGVQITVSFDAGKKQLSFEVIDTGIGIDEQEINRLFRPFEQMDGSTSRRFGGTGLGLAICHRLATALGGRIGVSSERGVGSRFRLVLPIHGQVEYEPQNACDADCDAQTANVAAESPKNDRLDLRLLVVDDSPDIRFLLRRLLEKAGCCVTVCEDGQRALEIVRDADSDAGFDAVIMDMQMPGMDGPTAVRQMRQAGFTRPVIALTANAMSGDRNECIRAGFSDYMSKPINRRLLIEKLNGCSVDGCPTENRNS